MSDPMKKASNCCLGMLFGVLTCSNVAAQDVVLNKIEAVVNEGVVLSSDVLAETANLRNQARASNQALPDDDVLRSRVLERLIDQEIRRQHAAALGITVDATSVNRAIEQIARNNNLNTSQFRDALRQQGFEYNQFRRNIEQEVLMSRLVQREVESQIKVTEQEIDDFIDALVNDAEENKRYRISHILIAISSSAAQSEYDAAETKANSIVGLLRAGADFAKTAAAESDGARALQGGDLGWRTLQEVPDFLAAALREMAVGDVSDPLRSQNGLHIVKLIDRESGGAASQLETLARHIFLSGDDPAHPQTLQNIKTRLAAGESFAALAAQFSQDPNSSNNGGELPWFTRGQLPGALEEAASTLQPGEISAPFQTPFGWHILEVMERRQREMTSASMRQQAEGSLRQQKIEQETTRWMRALRDESFVEIRS
ncbi:MAG: peptidylprolyl isomerase [Gammaproteobacteria bacterium]|nr:peptidylprolyl isomerase [Gammaproteobacteria bacterium]